MIFLSHDLNSETPTYGNTGIFENEIVRSIEAGDTCNNRRLTFDAHLGTHVDTPLHFDDRGRSITDFDSDYWVSNQVALIDVSVDPNHLILGMDELRELLMYLPPETDFLLLRTGYESVRGTDKYVLRGPGLGPDVGIWLRTHTEVRFIGFDFISLTSYTNRLLGRTAHLAFLGTNGPGQPILIVEDMHLLHLDRAPDCIIVAPLRVRGIDGAPVTVFATIS